jgi:hypothetical protein
MVTPFENSVKRVTAATAEIRNRFMLDLADEVVIGFASKGGMLEILVDGIKDKKVITI